MKLLVLMFSVCSLCFTTFAYSEEAEVPVTEEVAAEAAPVMEEKTEATEEKVEEMAAEAVESS